MAKEKSPIKLSELKKEYSKLNVMSTYKIEDTDKIVKFYQRFDVKKIEELIKELYQDISYAKEKDIDFFNNDEEFIKYELFLIIKHFSHFKDEIGETFEEKIEAFNVLISTGLYDLFFDEIFEPSEVYEVLNKVGQVTENAMKLADEEINARKEAQKLVKNKEILQAKK